jgi:hypothetical protein
LLLFVERVRPRVNQVFVFHYLHNLSFSVIHSFSLCFFAGPFFGSRTASPCPIRSPRLPSTPQGSSPVQSPRSSNTSSDSETPKLKVCLVLQRGSPSIRIFIKKL